MLGSTGDVGIDGACNIVTRIDGHAGIDGVCWDCWSMLGLTGYVGIAGVCNIVGIDGACCD